MTLDNYNILTSGAQQTVLIAVGVPHIYLTETADNPIPTSYQPSTERQPPVHQRSPSCE